MKIYLRFRSCRAFVGSIYKSSAVLMTDAAVRLEEHEFIKFCNTICP